MSSPRSKVKDTTNPYVGIHPLYSRYQHSVAVNQEQVFPILLMREIKVQSPGLISVDHSTFNSQSYNSLAIELTHLLLISHVFT